MARLLLGFALVLSALTGCESASLEVHPGDAASADVADAGIDARRRPDATQEDVLRPDADVDAVDASAPDLALRDAAAPQDVASDASTGSTSPGCVDGAGLPEGENTFMLEGRERRFIVRLPNGYTRERAWPLVFALHGNGGNAGYWDQTSGSRNIRGVLQDEAVLVIAEAIEGNWRDYNAPQDTWPARIESELLYFDELIGRARTNLCIDEREIFSMGFSGGGSFSGVLGCRRTDIRAIAVGGSVIYFDEAQCVGAPAAWITIGELELSAGREAYRDFFRDRAGCQPTSASTDPAPCVAYDGCGLATPVHYCEHPGDHIWPDFASQAMWGFFSRFVE